MLMRGICKIVEDMAAEMFANRPSGPGNNHKTTVWEYLKIHPEFEIAESIQHKPLITLAGDWYLVRTT
jgi:cephalosporin hydroxylase